MLGHLFGSNARVKILKQFLFNPEEKYYIRQLARKLKLQVNSVRRELENLEGFGILTSAPVVEVEDLMKNLPYVASGELDAGDGAEDNGGQEKKYYRANSDFVLFEEIRSLIIKAQILYGRDFINKLKKAGSVKLLIFTGKFVNRPEMPVDLLIVGRFNKPKFARLIKSLEEELGREINYTLMDSKEFKYRREVSDVFLYFIWENKKIVAIDEIGVM
jgi:hypothetical protein